MKSTSRNSDAAGFLGFAYIMIVVALVIGWLLNLIKIIGALGSNDLTPMFIARVVGAFFAPIGAVLGFF